jgi:hypothetical protein
LTRISSSIWRRRAAALLLPPEDVLDLRLGLQAVDLLPFLVDRLAQARDDLVLRREGVVLQLVAQVALEEELAGPAVDDLELLEEALDAALEVADPLVGALLGLEAHELLAVGVDLLEAPLVLLGEEVGASLRSRIESNELPEGPLGVAAEVGVGDLGAACS